MRRVLEMSCVLWFAAAPCFAQPDMRSAWDLVPIDGWRNPEMQAYTADLIVLGKIVKTADAEDMELKLPFREKAGTWFFVTYTVDVKEVIASRALPADGSSTERAACPAKGATVRVLTSAHAVAADKPIQFKGLPIRHDSEPVVGQTYLFILYRLTGRSEFYLPANEGYWDAPDAENLKTIRNRLDTGKWPWGKAESGIQIALFAPSEAMVQQGAACLNVAVAVRNASDEAIPVDLHPANKPLSLSATGADGKTASIELYRGTHKAPADGWFRTLQPGEVVFVAPAGLATAMLPLRAALGEGKWTVTAEFVGRVGAGPAPRGGWTGKARSRAVETEVCPEEPALPGGAEEQ